VSVLHIGGVSGGRRRVERLYRARNWPTRRTSDSSRRIPQDSVPEHTVAVFPALNADGSSTSGGSDRPCAWLLRPRSQSPDHASDAANIARISPIARCSHTRADNCANTSPGDDAEARCLWQPRAKLFHGGLSWDAGKEFFRAAPACVEPAGTSKTRFRRSKPDAHAAAQHFFYSRPLLPQPASDLSVVPFAGPPLGLLRGDPPLGQPLIDVPRMKFHPQLPPDQIRHARSGPKFRGVAELRGRTGKPGNNFSFLFCRQLGDPARMRLGLQPFATFLAVGAHPFGHGLTPNPEKVGNLLMRIIRANTVYGQQPSPLQLGSGSMRSHGILYACSYPVVRNLNFLRLNSPVVAITKGCFFPAHSLTTGRKTRKQSKVKSCKLLTYGISLNFRPAKMKLSPYGESRSWNGIASYQTRLN
jgi:hypothetical protein